MKRIEVVHRPWVIKREYKKGLDGQRIAILGYSHWLGKGVFDSASFTEKVVGLAAKGGKPGDSRFFNAIISYFGYSDASRFWNRVLFFNFVPCCIGESRDRYKRASSEQKKIAQERFLTIISQHRPSKVLVFSRAAWHSLPEPDHKDISFCPGLPQFRRQIYDVPRGTVRVYGLRHPQFAKTTVMHKAIKSALSDSASAGWSQ